MAAHGIVKLNPDAVERAYLNSGAPRLGFWFAGLTVVVATVFTVVAIATPPRSGPFCTSGCIPSPYTDVAQFIPNDYFWLIPGILLAPVFVGLMASVNSYATETTRVFGRVALSLAVVYATAITADYFIQFTVVVPSLQSGETQSLSLLTQYNPHGIFIALEVMAYMAMAAAFLAAAPVFAGGKTERGVRWTFVSGFVLAVGAFVGFWLLGHDLIAVEVAVLMIDWAMLIVGGALLAVVFRRA